MTKSGTGTWDLAREDSGTLGRGTRGRGDVGRGDVGRRDVGPRDARTWDLVTDDVIGCSSTVVVRHNKEYLRQ